MTIDARFAFAHHSVKELCAFAEINESILEKLLIHSLINYN